MFTARDELICRRIFNIDYQYFYVVCFFPPGATQPIVSVYFTAFYRASASSHTTYLITHSDAPQSVGLLWTNDQSVAETSTWQHTTLTTDKHPCPRVVFEPMIAGRRTAVDLRLRPRGYLDRQCIKIVGEKSQWKRPKGRTQRRRKHDIKTDLKESE